MRVRMGSSCVFLVHVSSHAVEPKDGEEDEDGAESSGGGGREEVASVEGAGFHAHLDARFDLVEGGDDDGGASGGTGSGDSAHEVGGGSPLFAEKGLGGEHHGGEGYVAHHAQGESAPGVFECGAQGFGKGGGAVECALERELFDGCAECRLRGSCDGSRDGGEDQWVDGWRVFELSQDTFVDGEFHEFFHAGPRESGDESLFHGVEEEFGVGPRLSGLGEGGDGDEGRDADGADDSAAELNECGGGDGSLCFVGDEGLHGCCGGGSCGGGGKVRCGNVMTCRLNVAFCTWVCVVGEDDGG
jgi:hypothetical protein